MQVVESVEEVAQMSAEHFEHRVVAVAADECDEVLAAQLHHLVHRDAQLARGGGRERLEQLVLVHLVCRERGELELRVRGIVVEMQWGSSIGNAPRKLPLQGAGLTHAHSLTLMSSGITQAFRLSSRHQKYLRVVHNGLPDLLAIVLHDARMDALQQDAVHRAGLLLARGLRDENEHRSTR